MALDDGQKRIVIEDIPNPASSSMRKTWFMWMGQIAPFMSSRGAKMPLYIAPDGRYIGEREFNKDDAHEMFCQKFGGVNDEGERVIRFSSKSDKHDALHAMEQILEWSTERGLVLTIPEKGEFMKLQREQNK